MRIRRKVDFLRMYGTKSHFLAVHGVSKISLGASPRRLVALKHDDYEKSHDRSKKECEKVTRVSTGSARTPPEEPYIRTIENGDEGLNRPQMTMETDMTEAYRNLHRYAA